jgi:hypothetical protein
MNSRVIQLIPFTEWQGQWVYVALHEDGSLSRVEIDGDNINAATFYPIVSREVRS